MLWKFLLLLTVTSIAQAQTLTRIGGDTESYFQDGIVFEHKPSQTKTRFRFRMQNRFTYETEDDDSLKAESVDFQVRRLRLRLEGNVLDSRFLYRLQLSFTRGDMDFDRTQYPNIMRDAVVGWRLSDTTTFWYGQTKLPGNRQRVISSGNLQLVDRSLLNATFNIDRDLGAQVFHRIGEEHPLWIKLAVSNGEGRATENRNNGLAYTGRVEWLPLGKFKEDGDYFEADLMREEKPKFSIGAVYSINKNTTRPGGQLGTQYRDPQLSRDIETWFGDALFKYRGFSWLTEYARRWTDDPYFQDVPPSNTGLNTTTGTRNVTIYKGQAISTQLGYVFENNIEPSVRYTQLWAHRETLRGANEATQYTAGLSKYFNQHRVKLQTDLTFDEQRNSVRGIQESAWIYRLQLEIGI